MREDIDIQIDKPATFTTKEQQEADPYWGVQLQKIRSLARNMIFKSQSTQKRNYDRSAKPMECKLGDTVYLNMSALGLTEHPKLRPMYSGPYIIQRCLSPTNVILSDVKTNNKLPTSFHINKLKRIKKRKKTLKQDNDGDTKGTSDNEVNKVFLILTTVVSCDL